MRDKVVVITGASSGVGALTAQFLSQQGAKVIMTARSLDKLTEVSTQMSSPHGIFLMDVTDTSQVNDIFSNIFKKYGKIDILINNAGFGVFQTFNDMPEQMFHAMMDVNYMGPVRCTKAVLPQMIAQGGGQIVNVISIAGKMGTAKATAYSASKHALLGFTNSLRRELSGKNVVITAINPGPIDTPFFQIADPTGQYVQNIKRFMLQPEQVAHAIIKAIDQKQMEVNLPKIASLGVKLTQLFPKLLEPIATKILNKK